MCGPQPVALIRAAVLALASTALAHAPGAAAVTFTVNSNLDEPNATLASTACSSTPSGVCTLRAAVMAANANPGADTIQVPSGTFHLSVSGTDDTAQAGDLDITDDVTISGAGAALTFVDGVNLSPRDRVFDVRPLTNATITGMTIRNGSTTDKGGAVRIGDPSIVGGDATLHLSTCSIVNNHAPTGGGLFTATAGSILTIASCNLDGNTGSHGGAVAGSGSLTVTNSSFSSNSVDTEGGAIYSTAGTATITGTTFGPFGANSSYNGGAIDVAGGTMTIDGGSITGNNGGQGAGILNDATLFVTGTIITGNVSGDSTGGGFMNRGTATLTRATVTANKSAFYAGGVSNSGTLTIVGGVIESNTATTDGGGGLMQFSGTTTATGVAIFGNSAGAGGGGVFVLGGDVTLTNSTVDGNMAGNGGAGVYNHGTGTVSLWNVTVSSNNSGTLFTVGGVGNDAGGGFDIANSLIAKNTYSGISFPVPSDCGGAITSNGFNLLGEGCGFTLQTGDQAGTFGNPLDPKIGPPADNGGATLTNLLLSGSPAIDAGNDSAGGCKDALGATLTTDQRGSKRPLNGRCDIGALELGPSGDVNGDGVVDVRDVFALINFLFAGGPSPFGRADANGDSAVNVSDVFYLINYLFAGGPAPM